MPEVRELTVLDWFAGQALIGLLAANTSPPRHAAGERQGALEQLDADLSARAYRVAGAMVAARTAAQGERMTETEKAIQDSIGERSGK